MLRFVAAAWLASQLAALAGAPVVLFAAPAQQPPPDCCPGVGPGQVCPMHHTRETKPRCTLCACTSHSDAALLSLTGLTGVLAASPAVAADQAASDPVDRSASVPAAGFLLAVLHPPPAR